MARTMDEAFARSEAPQLHHWSETADPDGPEMRALRDARDANPIVQEARRHQSQALKEMKEQLKAQEHLDATAVGAIFRHVTNDE